MASSTLFVMVARAGEFRRYVACACATLTTKQPCNYNVAMKTRIVKIGNSQGIRIPKLLLERSNLAEEVELEAEDNRIIIRSTKQPRQDWERAFRTMTERGDDLLLDNDLLTQTRWDEDEWQW
jgi:antitoxin MazE